MTPEILPVTDGAPSGNITTGPSAIRAVSRPSTRSSRRQHAPERKVAVESQGAGRVLEAAGHDEPERSEFVARQALDKTLARRIRGAERLGWVQIEPSKAGASQTARPVGTRAHRDAGEIDFL